MYWRAALCGAASPHAYVYPSAMTRAERGAETGSVSSWPTEAPDEAATAFFLAGISQRTACGERRRLGTGSVGEFAGGSERGRWSDESRRFTGWWARVAIVAG